MLSNGTPRSSTFRIFCRDGKVVYFFFFSPCFLRLHPWHVEVPRLGVESKLQLPAHTTATRDPSRVCDLQPQLMAMRIPNPLSGARDRTCNLMVPSWILFRCATMGTPRLRVCAAQGSSHQLHVAAEHLQGGKCKGETGFHFSFIPLSVSSHTIGPFKVWDISALCWREGRSETAGRLKGIP